GQLWRTTGDIYQVFDSTKKIDDWTALGTMKIVDLQNGLRKYAGPGHWNDPDMLEVGNGMSFNEDKAHFSMWAMLAAPLIAGNDLRKMSQATNSILTNKEVIAVDQDSAGIEGFKYAVRDSLEAWFKPLKNGDWAVCFLNRTSSAKPIQWDWQNEIITDTLSHAVLNTKASGYKIRDLWAGKELST